MPRGPRSRKVGRRLQHHLERFKGDRKDLDVCNALDISPRSYSRFVSGEERQVSVRVLQQLAQRLNVSVDELLEDDTTNHLPPPVTSFDSSEKSLDSVRRSIGQALLADARGDHNKAGAILAPLVCQHMDTALGVGYRIVSARAAAGLKDLETAEQLLRDAIISLQSTSSSQLLLARSAFELAIILARREKVFDALEAFLLAEDTLNSCGDVGASHLFFVRQHFLSFALRIGHQDHATRLLRISLAMTTAIEAIGIAGLSELDQQLLDALEAIGTKATALSKKSS